MAIILKTKKPVLKPLANVSDMADVIDEVGAMLPMVEKTKKQIAELKATLEPYEERCKKLQDFVDELGDPDDEPVEMGTAFKLVAGKRATIRTVSDIEAVVEILGSEAFLGICSVALSDIDKYLTEDQRAKVLSIERGKRKFKVVPRQE